ncbi:hypothetical protein SAMN05216302_102116 [Nitrosomonas aestuarii]|uniref:Uncharacterized protein n=1 Tax=Nitrosomonas aestuarii TaxID=52441 RepID=A0A1I4DES8_9PROT|nr:hypothetical protein [Nitrosomonas aestuarii]SFK92138.1 hypothetical protein SAMN05216302_102116 [Nitrosomonas aestuarii]
MSLPDTAVLSSKAPDEIVAVSFDFSRLADSIDSVVSVAVTVHKGTDASPAAMILNTPIISGTVVSQLIQGGLDAVFYKVRAVIAIGQQRYALSAILPVRAD